MGEIMKKVLLLILLFISGASVAQPVSLFNYSDGIIASLPGQTAQFNGTQYKFIGEFKNSIGDYYAGDLVIDTTLKVYQRTDTTTIPKYVVVEHREFNAWAGGYPPESKTHEFMSLQEIVNQFKDNFELIIENF